jgi:hypothetical protein
MVLLQYMHIVSYSRIESMYMCIGVVVCVEYIRVY